jgi:short-subunit dehydrogenase
MNLRDKRVLITGGTSGIGLATAASLMAKGAKVFITGRRRDGLASALEKLRTGRGIAEGLTADVATEEGRSLTLEGCIDALGGIDVLVNNAGGVRAGRLEDTTEAEIAAMVTVDLLAPILLTRAALPQLRANGDGLVVNITSGIALIGMPFYATYAGVKAGLAHFGEAMRRELFGEGVHVLTVYPGATDTPMMQSSKAGPEFGVVKEPPHAVAHAIVQGMESNALQVIRGGEAREKMIILNREDPVALDRRFADMKQELAAAVRNHSAL